MEGKFFVFVFVCGRQIFIVMKKMRKNQRTSSNATIWFFFCFPSQSKNSRSNLKFFCFFFAEIWNDRITKFHRYYFKALTLRRGHVPKSKTCNCNRYDPKSSEVCKVNQLFWILNKNFWISVICTPYNGQSSTNLFQSSRKSNIRNNIQNRNIFNNGCLGLEL